MPQTAITSTIHTWVGHIPFACSSYQEARAMKNDRCYFSLHHHVSWSTIMCLVAPFGLIQPSYDCQRQQVQRQIYQTTYYVCTEKIKSSGRFISSSINELWTTPIKYFDINVPMLEMHGHGHGCFICVRKCAHFAKSGRYCERVSDGVMRERRRMCAPRPGRYRFRWILRYICPEWVWSMMCWSRTATAFSSVNERYINTVIGRQHFGIFFPDSPLPLRLIVHVVYLGVALIGRIHSFFFQLFFFLLLSIFLLFFAWRIFWYEYCASDYKIVLPYKWLSICMFSREYISFFSHFWFFFSFPFQSAALRPKNMNKKKICFIQKRNAAKEVVISKVHIKLWFFHFSTKLKRTWKERIGWRNCFFFKRFFLLEYC